MRTTRLKVTSKNYSGLKQLVDSTPKFASTNKDIREAMNLSTGTWSYIRQSKSYKDFKELQARDYVPKPKVEKPVEQLVEKPLKKPANQPVPSDSDIVNAINNINITLTRLCLAWENTPTKKSWLK